MMPRGGYQRIILIHRRGREGKIIAMSPQTILLLLVLPAVSAQIPEIAFPSFKDDSCGREGPLKCLGQSSVVNGSIALIREPGNGTDANQVLSNVGRAMFRWPGIRWPASFDTNFTVLIRKNANSSNFGDGMAFLMTREMGPILQGSTGGLLGLFNRSTVGRTTGQLAVLIDTFDNEWETLGDFHVAVDTSGLIPDRSAILNESNVDLNKEKPLTYRVIYDGWKKNLEVMAGYAGEGRLISVLNHTVVIANINPIYVGFSAASGPSPNYSQSVRVLDWYFKYTLLPPASLEDPRGSRITWMTILAIFITVLGVPLMALLVFLATKRVKKWRRWRWLESLSRSAANAPKMYSYENLSRATKRFSGENLLGTGGFGSVYRGQISDPPSAIAVKRISATSKQGEKEYFAEICTIGRLRHKNIVQLQGWCHSGESLFLVYEFMVNGSLDRHIAAGTLDWATRLRILVGLASALLYLHEECGGTVVHRDVKPNNVLLDADFEAHLGDFGLARLAQGADRSTSTTVIAGTVGYLAPEFGYTGKATPESDVFSYGVVVLEVISGRRSLMGLTDNNLLDHVWNLYSAGELLRAVDSRLEGKVDEEEATRALLVGLMCAHPNPTNRPRSRKVVQILANRDEPLMSVPVTRPDTIVASLMGGSLGFEGTAVMSTSAMIPSGAAADSFSSSFLLSGR